MSARLAVISVTMASLLQASYISSFLEKMFCNLKQLYILEIVAHFWLEKVPRTNPDEIAV